MGEKTKWCRNAAQREGELQDWGMGPSVEESSAVLRPNGK